MPFWWVMHSLLYPFCPEFREGVDYHTKDDVQSNSSHQDVYRDVKDQVHSSYLGSFGEDGKILKKIINWNIELS